MVKYINVDKVDKVFAAIADPTRRRMVERLAVKEMTVKELRAPFRITGPAISKHLKILEKSGLLVRKRKGRYVLCKLAPAPLLSAEQWLKHYKKFWNNELDRLGRYLMEKEEAKNTHKKHGK